MLVRQLKAILFALVFIAYPVIVYMLLNLGLPWLGASIVIGLVFWKFRHRYQSLLWISVVLLAIIATAYLLGPAFITKLAPVMIHLALFFLFWKSLDETPFIEQFARLDFPELPPGIVEYCRRLTQVWAMFFAFNVVLCLALAAYDDYKLWTLYNGLIVYLLIALLVVGEYVWRRIRFPDLEVPSLRQSIQNIVQNGHQVWGKENAGSEQSG